MGGTAKVGQRDCVAHRKMQEKNLYNHVHDADSTKDILKMLAKADEACNRRKAKAPGELADMVSQGITRLQQLVQQQPSDNYASDS